MNELQKIEMEICAEQLKNLQEKVDRTCLLVDTLLFIVGAALVVLLGIVYFT